MTPTPRRPPAQSGVTLIELMIALLITSIVVASALGVASTIMTGYQENSGALRIDSKVRITLDMIATSVRTAGPGLPSGLIWDPCTGADVATITHTNSTNDPDQLKIVQAAGGAMASITSAQDLSTGALTVDTNASFEQDIWTPVVVIDPVNAKGHLAEVFADSSGLATALALRAPHACTGPDWGTPTYPAGAFIVRAVTVAYSVDDTTYSVPYLMVDPDGDGPELAQPAAEGIEDLQVAIGVDVNNDGQLTDLGDDTDEWFANDPTDATAPAITGGLWRALRVTIIARSPVERSTAGLSARPAAGDRAAQGSSDPFKRRSLSTTVQLRNMGGSE